MAISDKDPDESTQEPCRNPCARTQGGAGFRVGSHSMTREEVIGERINRMLELNNRVGEEVQRTRTVTRSGPPRRQRRSSAHLLSHVVSGLRPSRYCHNST